TCRSGRTGSAPRDETFGYARGLEEGQRLRGEMRQPLRGKKRVRRNTERGVMVETPPASPFKMIEPQLVLQLLVVPLDAPAQHRELDQIGARRRRRQRRQPILDRGGVGARPLDEQPLLGARRRAPVVAVRGPRRAPAALRAACLARARPRSAPPARGRSATWCGTRRRRGRPPPGGGAGPAPTSQANTAGRRPAHSRAREPTRGSPPPDSCPVCP